MAIFSSRVGGMDVKLGGSEIGRKSRKLNVLRMKLPISGNVPTSAGSVLRAFPASHGPYGEKSKFWGNLKIKKIQKIFLYILAYFPFKGFHRNTPNSGRVFFSSTLSSEDRFVIISEYFLLFVEVWKGAFGGPWSP